ncbi:hypothetical protein ELK74_29005, partial [Klebsiella pneumoniae]|nr:hypothetical protein [Klebsiella pneumoniae]
MEFDERELGELIENERREYAFTHVSMSNVRYEKHEEAFDLRAIEGMAAAVLNHLVERTKDSEAAFAERVNALYG